VKIGDLDVTELAALICSTLEQSGIRAVLTGGSCVSVWSQNEYASNDLDFITLGLESNVELAKALAAIGFTKRASSPRYFEHSDTHYVIEFPRGPLMVGDEHIREERIDQYATDAGVIRLLSPTDCIKDRLAAYYHWKDEQCLDQALMVARRQAVAWPELQRWHEGEGLIDRFSEFKARVYDE
jgi:hypothetical protein